MVVLVTGSSSGIGRCLSLLLSQLPEVTHVFAVARRTHLLDELKAKSKKIIPITADVGTEAGRSHIIHSLKAVAVTHVIHNAGVIEPVKKLVDVSESEFRSQISTNLEGPIFLTNALIKSKTISDDCRFLFISSGAAHQTWPGIGAYSIAKCALRMAVDTYRAELKDKGILFSALRPGGVDTPLLDAACQYSSTVFPAKDALLKRREENTLLKPEYSARFIRWVVMGSSKSDYEKDWNINDPDDMTKWESSDTFPDLGEADFFSHSANSGPS